MEFDVGIIGTGPAGLSAAIFGQRLGLRCVVFGDTPGGNLCVIEEVLNFPGFPEGVGGAALGAKMFSQAQKEGAFFPMQPVQGLRKGEDLFIFEAMGKVEFKAPLGIIACGLVPKLDQIPMTNLKGIHLCATCDGPLYRGRGAVLAIIGGGNTAATYAIKLSKIAQMVHIIYRGSPLKMEHAMERMVKGLNNVNIWLNTQLKDFLGKERVEGLRLEAQDKKEEILKVDGVFLAAGWEAKLDFLDMEVKRTPEGYIWTDAHLMTSVPGLFAAGDVRDTDLRQIIAACADGARAANHAFEYLQGKI